MRPMSLMLGEAPLARRARTTSISPAMVARSKGVHPVFRSWSTKRPLLPPRLGRCMLSCGLGSTSAASSALMISMLETGGRLEAPRPRSEQLRRLRDRHQPRPEGGEHGFSSIDDDVEGGASPPVPDVGIGAAIEQQFGDVVVVVIESEHQRSDAFRRRHIHIGAGGDQRLDAVIAAVARRIEQRGQSADGTILRAGLRRNLARPVAVERPRLDVGALRKKQLHHLARIFRRSGSPHQRRLIVKRFSSRLRSRRL